MTWTLTWKKKWTLLISILVIWSLIRLFYPLSGLKGNVLHTFCFELTFAKWLSSHFTHTSTEAIEHRVCLAVEKLPPVCFPKHIFLTLMRNITIKWRRFDKNLGKQKHVANREYITATLLWFKKRSLKEVH